MTSSHSFVVVVVVCTFRPGNYHPASQAVPLPRHGRISLAPLRIRFECETFFYGQRDKT